MNDFASILKSLMQENKTKTSDLAQYLGITKQAISNYTLGKTTPNFEILIKIAKYFRVSTDFLLTGITTENKAINEKMQLNLTNSAIENLRELSKSNEELLFYVNEILGDKEFFEAFKEVVKVIDENSNAFFSLLNSLSNTEVKDEILSGLHHFITQHCDTVMRRYFNHFFHENTNLKKISKVIRERREKEKTNF